MGNFDTHSESETLQLGYEIGQALSAPRIVLLHGDLGVGKTTLIKGIAAGVGVSDQNSVHSPTFTLINEYPTDQGGIFHVDLYRIESSRELELLGIEELLSQDAIVLIEWADKLDLWADKLNLATPDAVSISIKLANKEMTRFIQIEGLDIASRT